MLVCIVLLIGLVTLFACNKSDVADKDGQTKVIVKIQDEDGSIYKENVVFSDLFTLSLQKKDTPEGCIATRTFEAAYKGFQSQKRRYGLRQMDDQ